MQDVGLPDEERRHFVVMARASEPATVTVTVTVTHSVLGCEVISMPTRRC